MESERPRVAGKHRVTATAIAVQFPGAHQSEIAYRHAHGRWARTGVKEAMEYDQWTRVRRRDHLPELLKDVAIFSPIGHHRPDIDVLAKPRAAENWRSPCKRLQDAANSGRRALLVDTSTQPRAHTGAGDATRADGGCARDLHDHASHQSATGRGEADRP